MGQWRGHITKQTILLLYIYIYKQFLHCWLVLLANYFKKSNDGLRFLLEKSVVECTPLAIN